MFPYLEKYSTTMNTAQISEVPIYIHVKTSVIHNVHFDISSLANLGWSVHQITIDQMIAADRNVTTGLKRRKMPSCTLPIWPHFQLTFIQRHLSEVFSSTSISSSAGCVDVQKNSSRVAKVIKLCLGNYWSVTLAYLYPPLLIWNRRPDLRRCSEQSKGHVHVATRI